jgi:hypothetical protein
MPKALEPCQIAMFVAGQHLRVHQASQAPTVPTPVVAVCKMHGAMRPRPAYSTQRACREAGSLRVRHCYPFAKHCFERGAGSHPLLLIFMGKVENLRFQTNTSFRLSNSQIPLCDDLTESLRFAETNTGFPGQQPWLEYVEW